MSHKSADSEHDVYLPLGPVVPTQSRNNETAEIYA